MENDEESLLHEKPEQGNLFELEFNEYTPSGLGTAHLSGFAIASDEMEYAVKGVEGSTSIPVQNPGQVPAAEWFCTKLAELCGIATPVCKVLKCISDGEYVFGSRIEFSAWKSGLNEAQWLNILFNASDSLKKQMWAIYAFDQFVHNIDRHLNNYLYMENSRGQVIVKTFDFSLSSFVIGWPRSTAITLPTDSSTCINWSVAKQFIGDAPELRVVAINILDKIERIDVRTISDILAAMPEQWMPPMHREYLLKWWDSRDRILRLEAIKAEISS
ncbi:hypothetical protein AB6T85_00855 [Erwinia sp. ACCC 02193]|uniref:HipA-like C-terminal domain-containing protein n=1 Tax=Erwinia aeris TaxID=3239803 RepID=A0ABV4E292_9GAMM